MKNSCKKLGRDANRYRAGIAPIIFSVALFVLAWSPAAFAKMTQITFPAGATIQLELAEQLKSGEAQQGQTVRYFVRGNVIDDKRSIVIKDGAQAFGTVTESKKKGFFGKRGKLQFTVDYALAVDGTKIPLRANQKSDGKSGIGNVIGGVILAGPFGLLLKGGNVVVKQGTVIPAYVDKNTTVKVWRIQPKKVTRKR